MLYILFFLIQCSLNVSASEINSAEHDRASSQGAAKLHSVALSNDVKSMVPKHSIGYFAGCVLFPDDREITNAEHRRNLCCALACGYCLDTMHACCCEPVYIAPIRLCSPCAQIEMVIGTLFNCVLCIPFQCCIVEKTPQEARRALENGVWLRPRESDSAPPSSTDYIHEAVHSWQKKSLKVNQIKPT